MLARQGKGKTEHTGEIIARGDELIEKIIPFKIDFNHEKVFSASFFDYFISNET